MFMKSSLRIFMMLFMLSAFWVVNAQQRSISGKVVDSTGESLPGVSIVVKGTTNGTITDIDGNYQLSIGEEAQTLVYSFIGYDTQEVNVGSNLLINVTMVSSVQDIDEVVVVGYGTIRKSDLTGAVSKVGGDDLQQVATTDVVQTLQGKSCRC